MNNQNKSTLVTAFSLTPKMIVRNFNSEITKLGNIKEFIGDWSKIVVKATILTCDSNCKFLHESN